MAREPTVMRERRRASLTALPLALMLAACGGDEAQNQARVLVAGPSYTRQCEGYSGCDGSGLGWTTAAGVEVELSSANLMVLFGMAGGASETPAWAKEVVPGHDAANDFATDGGIVELPGESGFCSVGLGSRLCNPCRLRPNACEDCSVPPAYIAAWLNGMFVQWWLDLDAEVGPFACDVVPDANRWFVLEIRPRQWFEDVTVEMIEAHDGDPVELAPGMPLYDVVVERVTQEATFGTVPND